MSVREWTYYDWKLPIEERDVKTGVTIEWEFQGGGYSWEGWALVSKMSGDQKLYAPYIDSGCSCYSMYESKPEGLAWTSSLKEAASTLSRDIRDNDSPGDDDWAPDEKASTLASLSQAVMKLR